MFAFMYMDDTVEKNISVGRREPILQGESGSQEGGAAETCDRVFLWPRETPLLNMAKAQTHPFKKHLFLTSVRYDLAENKEWYNVTYSYRGADIPAPPDPDDPEPPVDPDNPGGGAGDGGDGVAGSNMSWSVDVIAREEPIATLKNFKEKIGSEENGAQYDEHGLFIGFSMADKFKDKKLGGVERYVCGGMEYTRTCLVHKDISVMFGNVGKISSPGGRAPTVKGRDWLYMGGTVRVSGGVQEVSEKWLLSDDGGWNKDIYSSK